MRTRILVFLTALLLLGLQYALAADPRPTATVVPNDPKFSHVDNCPVWHTSKDDRLNVAVIRLTPAINSVSVKVFRPGQPVRVTHGHPLASTLLDLRASGSGIAAFRMAKKVWVKGRYTIALHVPAEYTRPYRGLLETWACDVR